MKKQMSNGTIFVFCAGHILSGLILRSRLGSVPGIVVGIVIGVTRGCSGILFLELI